MREIFCALVLLSVSNLFALHKDLPDSEYYDYTAKEKQDYIYNKLIKYEHTTFPQLGGFLDRIIHNNSNKISTSAKIKFISRSRSYSGIYKSDALGYITLGLTTDYIPLLDIKFLIDDALSIDLNFTGIEQEFENNFDLFLQNFSSKIHDQNYQLARLAMRESNGRLAFDVKSPFELILVPSERFELRIRQNSNKDYRLALKAFSPGDLLYNILAKSYKQEEFLHIGDIMLESEFIASQYGDEMLFGREKNLLSKYFYNKIEDLF